MEGTSVPQQKDRVDMTEAERCKVTMKFVKDLDGWPVPNTAAAVGTIGEVVARRAGMDPREFFAMLLEIWEQKAGCKQDVALH
jgi:hypothetical protein